MRSNSCVDRRHIDTQKLLRSLKSCMLLLFSNDLDVLAVNKYQSRLDVDEIVQTMALLQRFL